MKLLKNLAALFYSVIIIAITGISAFAWGEHTHEFITRVAMVFSGMTDFSGLTNISIDKIKI